MHATLPARMSPMVTHNDLYQRAVSALACTHREIGDILDVSSRTIMRWRGNPGALDARQWSNLARAAYPKDRALARELASCARQTLESLGLVHPPPPPPSPAKPVPQPRELADSIVCAAAEAASVTPQAMRPALFAAFARACALGLDAESVRDALAPEPPPAPPAPRTR